MGLNDREESNPITCNSVAEKLVERYPQAEHLNWADFRGWSALIEAGANGKLDTVRFLLDKGANIMATDENRRNVLHVASLRGHLDVVRFLLNLKKELVNTVDAFGATPLLLALDQARSDVAAHLVSKDADIKCHDREGFTPAHVATLAGTIDTLKLLCTKDKSVLEAKDFRGRTPMLLAAAQGNLECVKFLVLQGSDLRTSDRLGRNAVMLAAAGGYAQIVRYLLDKQPGLIDLTDENCNPALDLATAEQVRVLLAKAYPAEHYVIARLNKINARTQQLATVQSGFTGSDDDFDSIRATMRKNRPEKVLQFVTRVLASAITRPLSDFETVDPPVNKIEALQARVVGIHENASIEEQVDAVRHRGRALIMMHQRCYNRQQVADAVAGCIEADTRKPVLASIEDLEQQISNWQREKRTLAEERAAYQTGLEELIKLIEPLKTRFKLPLEKTPELVSLSQFEGVIGNQADAFHTDFDQTTSRLAEDVRMLQTILNIVDVQSAQMRTKFQHDLAEGVREFDEAKAVYETAWSNVRGQVQQSYEVVSKQFADTSAQFEMINAQNPLGEIRKSYLTVLNRLENDKAFHERLLERLSQVQEEVVQLDATPISASAGESEKYKSVFRFEHDARVVAQGAECQGSASELIAPVLKASSVTEMVVPPELLVESEAPAEEEKVDTVEDHAAEAAPTARIITITPFSRGNSLQEIPIAPAENLTHSTSEISPAVSEASDVTISGPPPLPGRPKDLSIAPEGMTSIIPARLMQQLATAEPGSSASIRAVRETHSVAKMLKQFEAAAAIAEDPVPSPRPKSRSVSVSRQTQQ